MSHGDRVTALAPGFAVIGASPNAPFAITTDPARHFYAVQFHPEVHHTVNGARILQQLHRPRRLHRRLDHGRLQGPGDRRDPRPGRRRPGHLRPLRRRRLVGRRGADPRGDRRPAHLRLRRHRPDAPGRGRGGRHPVPRPLQHPADPRRRERPLPRRARRRHRPRGQAQDHRPAVHRGLRGPRRRGRRRALPRPGHALPRRHRERQLHRRPLGRRSRATTTSAACPSACT